MKNNPAGNVSNRTNIQWISDLKSVGPSQDTALEDLRKIILTGLPYSIGNYLSRGNPQFEPLMQEVAQETLLRVLEKLDTFEGRSYFTTWVNKIAVRIALSELRRRKWRDVSLDDLTEHTDSPPQIKLKVDKTGVSPETKIEQTEVLAQVEKIIKQELTDKQRRAMIAISIKGMPVEEVASRMNTSRNALYKLLHDARLRLKKRMEQEGLSPQDVLSVFEEK